MTKLKDLSDFTPGDYGKKRTKPSDWLNAYINDWTSKHKDKTDKKDNGMPPTLCLSRKIGVGTLQIADILAGMIGYRVVDRQMLEHMAADGELSEKTVAMYDERYPGRMTELLAMFFAEKSFVESDYARQLAKSTLALATMEPTIFVGRGTHLILPRDKVMSVRIIGSHDYRIKRLSGILNVTEAEAEKGMALVDKEQRQFFKNIYGKKDAPPYEFDLVVNMDYISDPKKAASIIAYAFDRKFQHLNLA